MNDFDILKSISTEVLEAELKRRKDSKPTRLEWTEWKFVTKYVESSIDSIYNGKGTPKDFEHFLMEAVLEAMYGKEIWIWWNNNQ